MWALPAAEGAAGVDEAAARRHDAAGWTAQCSVARDRLRVRYGVWAVPPGLAPLPVHARRLKMQIRGVDDEYYNNYEDDDEDEDDHDDGGGDAVDMHPGSESSEQGGSDDSGMESSDELESDDDAGEEISQEEHTSTSEKGSDTSSASINESLSGRKMFTLQFSEYFTSVWPANVSFTRGCWYCEFTLLSKCPKFTQIGLFTIKDGKTWSPSYNFGVGDMPLSWGLDLWRCVLFSEAKRVPSSRTLWDQGDVVGILLDADRGEVQWTLNGAGVTDAAGARLVGHNPEAKGGQFHFCVSGSFGAQFGVNLGEHPFAARPAGYRGWFLPREWALCLWTLKHWRPYMQLPKHVHLAIACYCC
eukprot:TRINITY_DN7874_c0_g1_i1.p1 TRINITY_DN7874_c0_g1~~TRINITY_DN7874_c0_g1_i1.p1  ORF type:complete len:359 (-),score=64.79 TRINITY_DN7874_c0_g1_i1:60-1136(-)